MKSCPCHSGKAYKSCCKPLHDGTAIAETPEALMRSRFSAFALGLGEYLVDTLARDHEDRAAAPREVLVRELSRAKDTQRFLGLEILSTGDATVTFRARIFEKGRDKSFEEESSFVREDGAWRYAHGTIRSPRTDRS